MTEFNPEELKKLYIPPSDSHKGQNGKLLLVGGSELFHAASLWSLKVASRIVDMVFYSSVPVNNQIVLEAKKEFRDGIVVPRENIEDYVEEADCILIGPGMVRTEHGMSNIKYPISNIKEIDQLQDEGEQTCHLTKYLLTKYPKKRWVIDGGALQMMEPEWLRDMPEVIVTPHHKEFERLLHNVILGRSEATTPESEEIDPGRTSFARLAEAPAKRARMTNREENVQEFAQEFGCVVLLKGKEDVVASPDQSVIIRGGNAGMTKGGTGDVLAGLVAALACKNNLFLSASAGSYINKKAGEVLAERVGVYFNSSDLVDEIPHVLHAFTS